MDNSYIIIGLIAITLLAIIGSSKLNQSEEVIQIEDSDLKNLENSDGIIFLDTDNNTILKLCGYAIGLIVLLSFVYFVGSGNPIYLLATLSIAIPYMLFLSDAINKSFKDFATENQFYYSRKGFVNDVSGPIFNLGHSHSFKNIIKLRMKNHKVIFFHYEYETGSGKNRRSYAFTILEVKFDAHLPRMLLNPKKSILETELFNAYEGVVKPMKINLDGGLCNTHELIAENNFQLEALEIFTTDFSDELAKYEDLRLDFDNNSINIICEGEISNKTELEEMFKIADHLIERIDPIKDAISRSVKEMEECGH